MPDLTPDLLLRVFLWFVAFLFSTTCHEAAHALVAKWGGDPTAALGGQVTLNPIPHIRREPFGMVLVPLLSCVISNGGSMIGWASAPYDPSWQRRYPRRAARMALAGPAANFTLMMIAGVLFRLSVQGQWFAANQSGGGQELILNTLLIFFSLNLLLGTFNLLPVPPLDGSTALALVMPERMALRYLDWVNESGFRMFGLIIAILLFRQIFVYIQGFAFHVLRSGL